VQALSTLSLLAVVVLTQTQESNAQSLRCTGSNGVEYLIGVRDNQKRDCEHSQKNIAAQTEWNSKKHSSRNFPLKISVSDQQSRDVERYKILREELEIERSKIATLVNLPKDGPAASKERSSALERHQQNISALNRELEIIQYRISMK
jgi:hypothetical protein